MRDLPLVWLTIAPKEMHNQLGIISLILTRGGLPRDLTWSNNWGRAHLDGQVHWWRGRCLLKTVNRIQIHDMITNNYYRTRLSTKNIDLLSASCPIPRRCLWAAGLARCLRTWWRRRSGPSLRRRESRRSSWTPRSKFNKGADQRRGR